MISKQAVELRRTERGRNVPRRARRDRSVGAFNVAVIALRDEPNAYQRFVKRTARDAVQCWHQRTDSPRNLLDFVLKFGSCPWPCHL